MTARRLFTGCVLLTIIGIALVVGIFLAPLVHISIGQTGATNGDSTTTGTNGGNTTTGTSGGNTTTGSTTPSGGNQQTTTGLSWSDLENKINLSPKVNSPGTPYANVYHVGDDNSGPYTASCYGNIVFELTATDGSSYIVSCKSNPNVPAFAGATIWNNGKDVCTIYREHLGQQGQAKLQGASC